MNRLSSSSPSRWRLRFVLFVVGALAVVGFFFRKYVFMGLIHVAVVCLSQVAHVKIDYQLSFTGAEGVELKDVHLRHDYIDVKASLLQWRLKFDEEALHYRPHLYCDNLYVQIKPQEGLQKPSKLSLKLLQFLAAKISLHVDEGVLDFVLEEGSKKFAFFLETNRSQAERATFAFHEGEKEFFHGSLIRQEAGYLLATQLEKGSFADLESLAPLFFKRDIFFPKVCQGDLDLQAKVAFSPLWEMENVSIDSHWHNPFFSFAHKELSLQAENIHAFCSWSNNPGFSATLDIEKGELSSGSNLLISDAEVTGVWNQSAYTARLFGDLHNYADKREILIEGGGKYDINAHLISQGSVQISEENKPIAFSYTQKEGSESILEIVAEEVFLPVFDRCFEVYNIVVPTDGAFTGSVLATTMRQGGVEYSFQNTSVKDLQFSMGDKEWFFQEVFLSGVFEDFHKIKNLELEMHGGSIAESQAEPSCTEAVVSCRIEENQLINLMVSADILGHPCSIDAKASDEPSETLLNGHISLSALQFFLGKKPYKTDIHFQTVAKILSTGGHWMLDGELRVKNPLSPETAQIRVSGNLAKIFPLALENAQAKMTGYDGPLTILQPLFQEILSGGLLEGETDFTAALDAGKMTLSVRPYFIRIAYPAFILEETREKDASLRAWELVFDLKSKTWKGKGLIYKGCMSGEGLPSLKNIQSEVEFDQDQLSCKELVIEDPQLRAKGLLKGVFGENPSWVFHFERFQSKLETLIPFFDLTGSHPNYFSGLQGVVLSKDDHSVLKFSKQNQVWVPDFSGKVQLAMVHLPLNPELSIKNGKAVIDCDSENQVYTIHNGVAEVFEKDKILFHAYVESLECTLKEIPQFSLVASLKHYDQEIMLAQLKAFQDGEEIVVDTNASTIRFCGNPLVIQQITLDKTLKPHQIVVQSKHSLEALKPIFELFPQIGSRAWREKLLVQKGATLDWVFSYLNHPELLRFTAIVDQIVLFGDVPKNLTMELSHVDKEWVLEAEDEEGAHLELFMQPEDGHVMISSLKARSSRGHLEAKGVLDHEGKFLMDIDALSLDEPFLNAGESFPPAMLVFKGSLEGDPTGFGGWFSLNGKTKDRLGMVFFTKQTIPFSYSTNGGLKVPVGRLYYVLPGKKENFVTFHQLKHLGSGLGIEEIHLQLTQEELQLFSDVDYVPSWLCQIMKEKELSGVFKLTKESSQWKLSGQIPKTKLFLFDQFFPLNGLRLEIDEKNICLAASSQIHEAAVNAEMRVDFSTHHPGILILKELQSKNSVKGRFQGFSRGVPEFYDIKGKFFGLEVDLKRDAPEYFSGKLFLNVFQMAPLMDLATRKKIAELKLEGGCGLEGKFSLSPEAWGFQGVLQGEKFSCFGYYLDSLQTKLSIGKDHVHISDFTLLDVAGKATIKRAKIAKNKEWYLLCPLVQLSEFRPSLLRKGAQDKPAVKSFNIQKASIREVEGSLSHLDTLRGEGELFFTNALKKEENFLSLSRDFIKDLGLDLAVLSPARGEVGFSIKDHQLVLTQLKNVCSEAERAEFFLAEDTVNFVDFSGDVHIDVNVRQNAMLKFIEPFTVMIRGSLKKPKYQLR